MYCHGLNNKLVARELINKENVKKLSLAIITPNRVILKGCLVKDHAAKKYYIVTN